MQSPSEIVKKYNTCINNQDNEGLMGLTDDNYIFIDSAGNQVQGKEHARATWRDFFTQYPDYKNEFERLEEKPGGVVLVTGKSICRYEPLNGPALWRVRVKDDKVLEWRVFDDTPSGRKTLGI
jgi:ketosteroid isomerase-like protein